MTTGAPLLTSAAALAGPDLVTWLRQLAEYADGARSGDDDVTESFPYRMGGIIVALRAAADDLERWDACRALGQAEPCQGCAMACESPCGDCAGCRYAHDALDPEGQP